MSPDPIGGPLCIELVLIVLCALFSAARSALENISEARLRHDAEDGDRLSQRLLPVKEQEHRYIRTIQTAVVLVCLIAGALAAHSFAPRLAASLAEASSMSALWLNRLTVLICVVLLAVIQLIFGLFVPDRMASQAPEKAAAMTFPLIQASDIALKPVTAFAGLITRGTLRVLGYKPDQAADEVTEEDIREMVDAGGETGAIEEAEKEMIENIFEFNNRSAEDVMTHRTKVACIQVNDSHEKIMKTIRETGLSRFPVYDKDIDDIIGVLNTRDYLLEIRKAAPRGVRGLLREAYFVPETVQADTLFRDMQKRKIHMAIVVDEYGGMSGIVTMEDLLEEIVGNIYDEFDPQAEAEITRLGENLWHVSGLARLEDISDMLDIELPEHEEYDTLAGLVLDQMTTIPDDGSQPEVDVDGLHIHVDRLREHRVESALVSKIFPEEKADAGEASS